MWFPMWINHPSNLVGKSLITPPRSPRDVPRCVLGPPPHQFHAIVGSDLCKGEHRLGNPAPVVGEDVLAIEGEHQDPKDVAWEGRREDGKM